MISLWDLGNVLVEWSPEQVLRQLNASDAESEMLRNQLLEHQDWRLLDEGTVTEEQVSSRLINEHGLSKQTVIRCFQLTRDTLITLDDSVTLLKELKQAGKRAYCLSNMSHNTYSHLQQREFFKLFDGIVISAQEQLLKPNPALFQLLLDRFQLSAADLFFIDDLAENIAGAKCVGMDGYVFKRSDNCYRFLRQQLLD